MENMDWEAAGAIGEIVGATGVILTLAYLAFQIRQNTRSTRAAESRRLREIPEHRFMRSFFQRTEAQFALYSSGILASELWELRCGYGRALLNYPIVKEIWELEKGNMMFSQAFVKAVESAPDVTSSGFLGTQVPRTEA